VAGLGLGVAIASLTDSGAEAASGLKKHFASMKDETVASFDAIKDALAAGDIGKAAKILWLTLKQEWKRGIRPLQEAWIGFKGYFQEIATRAVYGVIGVFTNAWASIRSGWAGLAAAMAVIWTTLTTHIKSVWGATQDWLTKAMLITMAAVDPDFTIEEAIEHTDKAAADRKRMQQDEADAKFKSIRDTFTGDLDAAEADRAQFMAGIDDARRRDLEGIAKGAAEAMTGMDTSIANARRELQQARAEAKQARRDYDTQTGKGRDKDTPPLPDIETAKQWDVRKMAGISMANITRLGNLMQGTKMERLQQKQVEQGEEHTRLLRDIAYAGGRFGP